MEKRGFVAFVLLVAVLMAVTNAAAATSITPASTTTTTTTVKFIPFAPDHCCTPAYVAGVARYIISGAGGVLIVYILLSSLIRRLSEKAKKELLPVRGVLTSGWILVFVLSLAIWGVVLLWLASLPY